MDWEKKPSIIKILNLVLAFLLELAMLVILGYAGMTMAQNMPAKIGLAIGLPAAVAVIWGFWLAPASKTRLSDPWLTVLKIMLFSLTAVLLYFTGLKGPAIVFEIIVLLNLVLLYIYRRG